MNRCIQLAKNGLGTTYPNPLVGSVIVYDGKIIGEGWHRKSGGPHAEVNAINSVKDKSLLTKSTIYVSLEPCSHFGKTPPCCDLILEHQIPDIVVGTIDPFEKVLGSGIEKLAENGKNVISGILDRECRELNKRFFTFHQKKRPYIILKWAETQDEFIAPENRNERQPVWITNSYSRQLVHKWRSEEQAVLVGTQTVIDDNPTLTTRDWHGSNPVRIVIDRRNRIPKENHIFDNQAKTIVLSDAVLDFTQNSAIEIANFLFREQIQSVIIEGGRKTLQTFIDTGIWDEARVFKGSKSFGNGVNKPVLNHGFISKSDVGNDELLIFRNND